MKKRRRNVLLLTVVLAGLLISGCSRQQAEEEEGSRVASENVVITETGEVIEKPTPENTATRENQALDKGGESPSPIVSQQEAPTPAIDIDIPVQEQVITEEDQTEPEGHHLQLVFLGDSIFDNNRDGTGVPYLTAKQCLQSCNWRDQRQHRGG